MNEKLDTVIIGGGQAGLATSYYLTQARHNHVVLEQAPQAGNAWRNDRWDSFCLNTPNWSFRLPGAEYQDNAPHGFMPLDQIVTKFEAYVEQFQLPVLYGARVISVKQNGEGKGYLVTTEGSVYETGNVVVATGLFQKPKIPAFAVEISTEIKQLHSGQYRNPKALAPGAVLVVGSSQSGSQIAEELYLSGRKVYLCVGSPGRFPRRYRGKDLFDWFHLTGFLDKPVDSLPTPKAKFAGSAHVSGRDGGRTLNLHQFARDGVILLGRLHGANMNNIQLAPDLKENLIKIDQVETDMLKMIDDFILETGMAVLPETLPKLGDGFAVEEISELNLESAGITNIIWATGYTFDFRLVKLAAFDRDGYPNQKRGVSDFPGLFFIGLPWLSKLKSGLLVGVGEDANFIASAISTRSTGV